MDVKRLSNTELKEQLLKHGVNPGPILPSTRGVYEKKLQQLLEKIRLQENGDAHQDQYSDSDDEGSQCNNSMGLSNGVKDEENGAILNNYNHTNVFSVNDPAPRRSSLPSGFTTHPSASQYTHIPACIAAEFNQARSTLGDDFSVTKMLKQMDRRSSLGQALGNKNKDGKNWTSNGQSGDAPSDFSELLSQSALGMSATRRKPIKGAAGRPIQFQYDDIVKRAKMKEQSKEIQEEKKKQRLVSIPMQITIFVLVAFIVLVLLTMESSPENPFEPLTAEDTKLQQPFTAL
ncbi:LEM domain-containing protein 1 isoform X1 [Pyxicephalus adspersus]|uniref:LEM domain-containing protein 1 isoform X1 n=1 Tax=Pyxicephalus adspersus TaxID=30357 RepID=UPI003B59F295